MPRKALRCCVELEIQVVTCPGVYVPRRDDVYLTISLFREHRHTRQVPPSFPLLFHQRFGFDKVFYAAYQPQQVADALEDDCVRIELVQLSDILPHGRLLARYECNARDFLYPYPEHTVNYGSTDRHVLMDRSMEFPGIAPKLEFSTKTVLKEVDRPAMDPMHDVHLVHDSMMKRSMHSPRSPMRSRSLTRQRSSKRKHTAGKSKGVSFHHRRPTTASVSHCRSKSPGISRNLQDMSLRDSLIDEDNKPPFVVRKVGSDLIGRHPGTRHPCPHKLRRSKSRSPPRHTIGGVGSYLDEDYRLVGSRPWYSYSHKPRTDSYYSSYSLSELEDSSDVMSDASDPGPASYRSTSRPVSAYPYRHARSPSPVNLRQSLRDRFQDDLGQSIASRVDSALRRNRSKERSSREQQQRSSSRGSIIYYDEDFDKIRDLERDLEIARNRSMVHVNDGEYWTQKANQYKGESHRTLFNNNMEKVYSDMYNKAKKFDDRVY